MESVEYNNISVNVSKFLSFLADNISGFGNTLALVSQRGKLAMEYGKSTRTIVRYIDELEEKGYVETRTKRGEKGGTVIVLNADRLSFDPQPNPIMDETLTIDEIVDQMFPKKKPYQAKKKYRPRKDVEEERLRKKFRKDKNEELNDLLESEGLATKKFWQATDNPELYYRAWLISRMYNFYPQYMAEEQKNLAESSGDVYGFALWKTVQDRFEEYDCLPERFIGTWQFTSFVKLVEVIDTYTDMTPENFLTVQFEYWEYLMLNSKNKNIKLPYLNTLYGEDAIKRWTDTHAYRKGHLKEHPYYDLMLNPVQSRGTRMPYLTMLTYMYTTPFDSLDYSYDKNIEDAHDIFMSMQVQTKLDYFHVVNEKIEKNTDLTDDERLAVSRFIQQQVGSHIVTNGNPVPYMIANQNTFIRRYHDFRANKRDNYRELYEIIGTYNMELAQDILELSISIKKGYEIHYSMFGNADFLKTIRTITENRSADINTDDLKYAISKLGEDAVPISKYGELDMRAIARKNMTDQEIWDEQETFKRQLPNEGYLNELLSGEMWYEVKEMERGQSKRDGKRVNGVRV